MPYVQHPLIKPNSIEARTYQQVIFSTAIKGNTLVVLPTGMGKTQIAIMVAAHRLASIQRSKVLMMAPTRPLALQHRQSFCRFMTLPEREFQVLTGETPPARRKELWRNSRLVFATPQVVEHDLLAGRLSLGDFSLLIFDEAHRAVGDYPYAFIAERYVREAMDPLILALTASPGADAARIEEVKRNLFIEHVEIRGEKDLDVLPYVKPIEIEWRRLELPKEFVEVKQLLEGQLKEQLALLRAHGFISHARGVGKRDLLEVQKKIQAAVQGPERPPEKFYAALVAQAAAIRLCHAIELLETQGLAALERYLARLLRRARMPGATKALKVLANDPRTWRAFRSVQRLREGVEHPKLEEAARVLRAQFEREPNSRAIVFAHYRDSVDRLFEVLDKLPGIRPVKFIGQAARGTDAGMSQREQAQILEAFRAGEYNVLISTSVGEEGLDIPSVDLVLFYEAVPSEIRSIQRRGRTGRAGPGRVVVLLAKGTRDEAFYWSSVRKEQRMREALAKEAPPQREGQKVLSDFIQPEVKVIVDHREMASGVARELSKLGVAIEARQLDVGDYILSDRVGVERKTVQDFLQSIVDKRLLEQAKLLADTFERPVLVLEGELGDLYSLRAIHPNAIRGALAALAVDLGISILPARDEAETAALLASIARREQTEHARELAVRGEPKGLTLPEQQRFIVEGLPGVSAVLAERLLAHFKTPERVMMASEEELQEVPGIGKVKAREIRRVLTSTYNPDAAR